MTHYLTIEKEGNAEFKDRGSRFIAYAFPVEKEDEFKKKLKAIRKEHPGATHHCYAFRLGADGHVFRTADDGEPAGSAGKPILNQLHTRSLTNLGVVVVRYFGGTLLGVPGLIQAYKTSTSLVLQTIPAVQKPILACAEIRFNYPSLHDVMQIVRQYRCSILEAEQGLFCRMKLAIPEHILNQIVSGFEQIGVDILKITHTGT